MIIRSHEPACKPEELQSSVGPPKPVGAEAQGGDSIWPEALAHLELWRDGCLRWVVQACGACGRRHFHGAGGLPGESGHPRLFLGPRSPHCPINKCRGGYLLVDRDPQETERFLERAEADPCVRRARRLRVRMASESRLHTCVKSDCGVAVAPGAEAGAAFRNPA